MNLHQKGGGEGLLEWRWGGEGGLVELSRNF